jgi:Ni,Fe-hydrogenase III small subunit/NAD-dependent dihydropyrimidine dehydrogenase PreA subunit
MFELLNLRIKHGRPVIADLRHAELQTGFRGFPLLDAAKCTGGCSACGAICPTDALALKPLRLDLGKCIFCGECERRCPGQAVRFSPASRLGASSREALIISAGQSPEDFQRGAIKVRKEIKRLFGHSLKLRQVSAGGCNACEMELAACGNVNFDMGRFGIDFVASPRHADGIVITGPITGHMAPALQDAYLSVSTPKIVISVGACAISGGLFAEEAALDRSFLKTHPVDLYVPGCPPHPLTFIQALLDFLGA